MKLFSLKAIAAAVVLAVPMMASAQSQSNASIRSTSYTDTLTFTLGLQNDAANNMFDYASGNTELYNVVVNGTWTNMSYFLLSNSTGPDTINYLDGDRFNYKGKGNLDAPNIGLRNHLTGGVVSTGPQAVQLTFAGLSTGRYEIKFTGYWDKVRGLAGQNQDWGFTRGTTDLTIGSVSLVSAVPEPETYAMLLAGLGLMGTIVARRRKAAEQA